MVAVLAGGAVAALVLAHTRRQSPHSTPAAQLQEVTAIWHPSSSALPANALKLHLEFSHAMTESGIFEHLSLTDVTRPGSPVPVAGAFREVPLWSPDLRLLTVWLHPGRQKTGVNLNEDEGPVLIEGHRYRLSLSKHATTTEGAQLGYDRDMEFTASAPVHARVDPQRWQLSCTPDPADASCRIVRIGFPDLLDWAMLHMAIKIDGEPCAWQPVGDHSISAGGIHLKPGPHQLHVNPRLEDIAGNNLLRPFELETSDASPAGQETDVQVPFIAN